MLSLKVLTFNLFNNTGNISKFTNTQLQLIQPDIICTQEDNSNNPFGKQYKLIAKCGWCSSCEIVAAYYNTKTINPSDIISVKKFYTSPYSNISAASRRNCLIFTVKGITIANIHLEGGRYVDLDLLNNNKVHTKFNRYLDYKCELLYCLLDEKIDIICGDFNSVYNTNQYLQNNYLVTQYNYFANIINRVLTVDEKLKIKKWNEHIYKTLLSNNYKYISPNNANNVITTSRGMSIIDGFFIINSIYSKSIKANTYIIELDENIYNTNYEYSNYNYTNNNHYLINGISDHNPVLLSIEL